MRWQVVMDDDGTITLPANLIAKMGWTPETRLRWSTEKGEISLQAIDANDDIERP